MPFAYIVSSAHKSATSETSARMCGNCASAAAAALDMRWNNANGFNKSIMYLQNRVCKPELDERDTEEERERERLR